MVSVVIPTHNRKDYIGETVDSVLAQTYSDLEVIVVDDGSTDGTGEYMRSRYENDKRVRYIWQENAERSAARNRGIDEARGEYVAFLDSDDLWLPKKLELQVQLMEAQPELVMVLCWTSNFGLKEDQSVFAIFPEEEDCAAPGFNQRLATENRIIAATPLVRKSVFEQCGKFCLDKKVICFEDWELWIRIACFGPVAVVPRILVLRRHHEGNTEKRVMAEDYRVIISNVQQSLPGEKWSDIETHVLKAYWHRHTSQPPRRCSERMISLVAGFRIFGRRFYRDAVAGSASQFCWYVLGSKLQNRMLRSKSYISQHLSRSSALLWVGATGMHLCHLMQVFVF